MNKNTLNESIRYLLEIGVDSQHLSSLISESILLEKNLRHHKRDRDQERSMSSPVTRATLSRSASRPSNQRRMKAGFQRWLKLQGRKNLSKTAKRRFESNTKALYEWEDVKLTIEKDLIDLNSLTSRFIGIQFTEGIDDLSKLEFLYKEYKDEFCEVFRIVCEENGIIVDPLEEDTTTADIATTNGGVRYNNQSPWKLDNPNKKFWYPRLIQELKVALQEICDSESDGTIKETLYGLVADIELIDYDNESEYDHIDSFVDFLYKTFGDSKLTNEERELIDIASSLQLTSYKHEAIKWLSKSDIRITNEMLSRVKNSMYY